LLQKRLLAALSATLLDVSVAEERPSVKLQSGRPRPQRGVSSPSPPPQTTQSEVTVVAKGFEDSVLAKQCSIAASTLERTVGWVERVWGDTILS